MAHDVFSIKIGVLFFFCAWGFSLNLLLEVDGFPELLATQRNDHLLLWNTHHFMKALTDKKILYVVDGIYECDVSMGQIRMVS